MIDKSISIVVPVYNGKKYLDELVKRICLATSEFSVYEIILVDDSSPDNSYKKISEIAKHNKSVKGFLLDENYGQQNAILCGLAHAVGDYVAIMDDDLENPPESIPVIYSEIIKGYDVVYALDQNNKERTFFRRFGSLMRDATFRLLTKLPKGKKVCSYRMITGDICRKIALADTSFIYISMEILKYTSNVSNIKVKYGKRNRSGHSSWKLIKLLSNIHIYYSFEWIYKLLGKKGKPYSIAKSTEGESL